MKNYLKRSTLGKLRLRNELILQRIKAKIAGKKCRPLRGQAKIAEPIVCLSLTYQGLRKPTLWHVFRINWEAIEATSVSTNSLRWH
jgi:hypothetical protein